MRQKTSPIKVGAAERERQAVQMRIAGADYQTIADALGMVKSGAYKAVKRALEKTRQQTAESADELRQIEQNRLERLIVAAMPQALKGDVQSIEAVRRLSESLRKLNGLDAPAKTDVTSGGDKIAWIDFIMGEKEDDGITKPSGQ